MTLGSAVFFNSLGSSFCSWGTGWFHVCYVTVNRSAEPWCTSSAFVMLVKVNSLGKNKTKLTNVESHNSAVLLVCNICFINNKFLFTLLVFLSHLSYPPLCSSCSRTPSPSKAIQMAHCGIIPQPLRHTGLVRLIVLSGFTSATEVKAAEIKFATYLLSF